MVPATHGRTLKVNIKVSSWGIHNMESNTWVRGRFSDPLLCISLMSINPFISSNIEGTGVWVIAVVIPKNLSQRPANSGSQWRAFFYALYDSHNPLFPYFVAKHQARRNNSDKYLAFFLESAKNFLTFAISIRTNDIWETRNSKFNNLKFIRLWNRMKRTARRLRS